MSSALLEVKRLTKYYNQNCAIEDISLKLYANNVHALIGENGAGKSTLIKILTGIVTPTNGEIFLNGQKTIFKTPQDAIQNGIVAVHQELTLVDTMTVSENIWLGHEPLTKWGTIDFKEMTRKSLVLFEDLELDINPNELVGSLSLADKQLIEFVKAMSYNPKVLILDEATSTIGEKEVEKLNSIVKKLKLRGNSIIFISHRMKELFQFCDTFTILKDGLQVIDGDLKDLTENEIVENMTGYEVEHSFPPKLHDVNSKNLQCEIKEILKINNLQTSSGLKNISFDLYSGEIVGIGGLQGHGQIELIHALFGLEEVIGGEIKSNGQSLKINSPRKAMNEGIQLVPQDRKKEGLFIELNVGENIIPCSLDEISQNGVISRKKETRVIEDLINKLRIKVESSKQIVKYLSGGNQQKIALGKWLLKQGKVLMLIEPTRGIDINTKMEIYNLLRQLTHKGYGVIISTNELLELVGLCDRVLVMYEKKIITELSNNEITEQNIVAASFGKKSLGGAGDE